jgi:tRNA dimethylallyltransferase
MAAPEESQLSSSPLSARPVLLLAGPTAAGKSQIALELAEKLDGEIVSVDSMQVYRGLDVGTAKPSKEDRARVAHHLIDVAEPGESFDAARFVRLARQAVAEIQARKRVPILCGGTGLYFKAFLEGLGEAPPADAAIRAQLEKVPLWDLLCELSERDPACFARIDRRNPRRVMRALEVIRLTGKPFSEQRAPWDNPERQDSRLVCFFGLARGSADLQRRINARVDEMFQQGLVDETRRLLEAGLDPKTSALQGLGYRQVVEHLLGQRSLEATIELVKIRTRQYSKRQMTWFRRQHRMTWISLEPQSPLSIIIRQLAETFVASAVRPGP